MVPLGGDAFEIGGGVSLAFAMDDAEAGVVAFTGLVFQQVEDGVDQGAGTAVGGDAVEDAGSVGETFDQAGVSHQLQVAGDAGLALVEDARQLHHRQFLTGQQRQDAQAGRLAGGAQHIDSLVGGEGHGACVCGSYKDILI